MPYSVVAFYLKKKKSILFLFTDLPQGIAGIILYNIPFCSTPHFSHLFTIHLFPFFRYNYRKRNASICLAYLLLLFEENRFLMGTSRKNWTKKKNDKKLVKHRKKWYNGKLRSCFLFGASLYRSSYLNICICSFY